ncbi:hypothetical protein PL8927_820041 [Planktothrix serta PCC 8927]|uniref:Cas12f1-like TNB domain-containing protein n=1 Tax=Planktothrix serta PCC 8927 TaxID=671068 RepID=A0A7Z9C2U4_9CYAN|nr:hypothetical protein PL8927_820041 [Planktothrix serta PCC 8927]
MKSHPLTQMRSNDLILQILGKVCYNSGKPQVEGIMLVVETKLKNGTSEQYQKLDESIRTAQFVRNKCVKYWMENKGTTRNDLQKLCAVLAKDSTTPWASKLNSQARQSSADRAWQAISRFSKLVEIDRWFPSSKLCSNCFYQVSEMPLDMREWTCPDCGTDHDRDGNAAINIRAEGIRMLKTDGAAVSAVGGDVRPYLGQKPKLWHSPVSTEADTVLGTPSQCG